MAVWSTAQVRSRLLIAEIDGSKPAESMKVRPLCLLCVVQLAASATRQSLVQWSFTSSVSLCDLVTSTMRWPRPELGCCVKKNIEKTGLKKRSSMSYSPECTFQHTPHFI